VYREDRAAAFCWRSIESTTTRDEKKDCKTRKKRRFDVRRAENWGKIKEKECTKQRREKRTEQKKEKNIDLAGTKREQEAYLRSDK